MSKEIFIFMLCILMNNKDLFDLMEYKVHGTPLDETVALLELCTLYLLTCQVLL